MAAMPLQALAAMPLAAIQHGAATPQRHGWTGGVQRRARGAVGLRALVVWQVAALVSAPLSMELEVPDGVVADDAPMQAAMGSGQVEPAGRSIGGRLRSMAEDFIPTAIIDRVAEVRKPKDTDGSQTAAPDDGEGCSDQIGKDDVGGMNPLYRCAFDRKKCYEYKPDEVEGEQEPYCEGNLDWPIFFSPAESTSIDVDSFRGDGLHAWVGSSAECVDAWHKFSCAYTYDRCDPVDGSVVKGKDAPSCRSRCNYVLEICGEETVAAMLKTTKRFLGQQRFERLSKVFWCENFATDGGCLYNTPSGGAEDAVLWPGHEWNSDEVDLLLDAGEEAFNMESLPEL